MEIKDGFFRDDLGSKSMGRLLSFMLIIAAIVTGIVGTILDRGTGFIVGLVGAMITGAAGLKAAQKFAERE